MERYLLVRSDVAFKIRYNPNPFLRVRYFFFLIFNSHELRCRGLNGIIHNIHLAYQKLEISVAILYCMNMTISC